MKMKQNRKSLLVVLCWSVFAARLCAQSPHYGVTVLEDVGEGSSMPMSINAKGQVTGISNRDAVVWNGTKPTILGTLLSPKRAKELREWRPDGPPRGGNRPPTIGWGYSINASGQIAGCTLAENSAGHLELHLVRWTNLKATDLGPTLWDFHGFGINGSGQVVGQDENGGVIWTGTTPTRLGHWIRPHAINDAGQVVGGGGWWNGTVVNNLVTMRAGAFAEAYSINASSQIAGYSYLDGERCYHAVIWNDSKPTDLGTLGGDHSMAYGINIAGDAVGTSTTVDDPRDVSHPFLYHEGNLYDLQSLIVRRPDVTKFTVYSGGNCINDAGQIVGNAFIAGKTRAVVLTPEQ